MTIAWSISYHLKQYQFSRMNIFFEFLIGQIEFLLCLTDAKKTRIIRPQSHANLNQHDRTI